MGTLAACVGGRDSSTHALGLLEKHRVTVCIYRPRYSRIKIMFVAGRHHHSSDVAMQPKEGKDGAIGG